MTYRLPNPKQNHDTSTPTHSPALVAHVSPRPLQSNPGVTVVAESLVAVFDEAQVCQLLAAHVAAEAGRVPAAVHRLDDATDDELVWGRKGVEGHQA